MKPNEVYIELLQTECGWEKGTIVKAEREGMGVAFYWVDFRVGLSAEGQHYRELNEYNDEETKELKPIDARIEIPDCEAC